MPRARACLSRHRDCSSAGAAELIRTAHALGLPVGVASSGHPAKLARNLALSGLAPLLDASLVVSTAAVGRGKPAPDVYNEVLRRMGCRLSFAVPDAARGTTQQHCMRQLLLLCVG